jgi:CubicO group peptidase (beta-lactamase class C family)
MRKSRAIPLAAWAALAYGQTMNWKTVMPTAVGLDPVKLEAWRANLAMHHTTGILVIRRGHIALEWYAAGWDADRPHGTASMAKALVGGMSLALAMSDGRISPDDLASRYIPGWSTEPLKSKIRIRHLATHTSGISDAEQDEIPHDQLPGWKGNFWKRTPDPFSIAVREAPVLFQPGTQYAYSNPGMAALSYAVTASLKGGDIRTLLQERVLEPIGVPERHWSIGYGRAYAVDGLKLYANWGGASFTARAAARIGQLTMLRGQWNGRELIRRDVVKTVLTDQGLPRPERSITNPAPASGLAWYTNEDGIWPAAPRDAFAGAGAGHEIIIVVPSLDLIVVRNGDALRDTKPGFWEPVYDLVLKPLLEAVTVQAPYPPSPVIRGAVFGKEIRRRAIDSDNWPLTWGDDDAQYTSYGDGIRLRPEGGEKARDGIRAHTRRCRRLSRSESAVGRRADGGRREQSQGERNRDGSRGALSVGQERGEFAAPLVGGSREDVALGLQNECGLGSPTFLNFGRNYAGARDAFVYTYSQDGPSAYESDNGVALARVAKDRIRDRVAWEFFSGLDAGGAPVWTADIDRRAPVFVYPANCQRVDVTYDPGIQRYLMALGYDHDGGWGLFDAPQPWGPWTTILHRVWDVAGTHGYRLPAKWMSPDGLTMTLVFSGVKPNDAFCTRVLTLKK